MIKEIKEKLEFDQRGFWKAKDEVAISYPKDGNEGCAEIKDRSFWFRHRNQIITNGIKNFPPRGLILNVGGGNGCVAKGLADAGFDCALIEPGEKGASEAIERGVKHVLYATLESMYFGKSSIPAVGLFDVVEHIENDLSFLKKTHSLLIPDGRLYATVPAFNVLWSSEDESAGHFRRYTKNTISSVLKGSRF